MNQAISLLEWWSIISSNHYFLTAKTEWAFKSGTTLKGVYHRFTQGDIDKDLDYILRAQLRGVYDTA